MLLIKLHALHKIVRIVAW